MEGVNDKKIHRPIEGHEDPEGQWGYISTLSLTSSLDGVRVNAKRRLL